MPLRGSSIRAVAIGLALMPAAASAAGHTLYIDANLTGPGKNAVLAYRIAANGGLTPLKGSPFATGGTGFFDPSYALGPFDVDQELAVDAASGTLYAVNAGSDTISAFRIAASGSLTPVIGQPFRSHGSSPVSLGLRGDTMVTVNNAQNPLEPGFAPSLTVASVAGDGALFPIPRAGFTYPTGAQPSQALVPPGTPFVFTAEFPGGGQLRAFYQLPDGTLLQTDHQAPPAEGATQPLPLGLWAHPSLPLLYVGFVNTNELGVYRFDDDGRLHFIRAVPNSGQALCWIRISRDGRRLYTANTADQSMSVYDLSTPDDPVEIQHLVLGGAGGLQQFSLTPDGKFLYVIEQQNSPASAGQSNRVFVLSVDAEGLLAEETALTLQLHLPAQTRPFGIAIR